MIISFPAPILLEVLLDLATRTVDVKKEIEGTWIEYGKENEEGETGELLIARINNPAYNKLFTELSRPYARRAKQGDLSESKALQIMAVVVSKTILLGWRGIVFEGKDLPYSQEKAQELLSDPKFKPFRDDVIELANDESLFRQEEIEKEAGEQKNPLSGS